MYSVAPASYLELPDASVINARAARVPFTPATEAVRSWLSWQSSKEVSYSVADLASHISDVIEEHVGSARDRDRNKAYADVWKMLAPLFSHGVQQTLASELKRQRVGAQHTL